MKTRTCPICKASFPGGLIGLLPHRDHVFKCCTDHQWQFKAFGSVDAYGDESAGGIERRCKVCGTVEHVNLFYLKQRQLRLVFAACEAIAPARIQDGGAP